MTNLSECWTPPRLGPFQDIALPTHWPSTIKWAIIETISLAHRAITTSRSYAVNSRIERVPQIPDPVNKVPEYVRTIVKKLKVLCPTLGKRKIADILAMAGLHLAATSVWRFIKEPPLPQKPDLMAIGTQPTGRVVTSKYPNHVWHVDMTVIPTSGFRAPWWPFCLAQVWPFCWWVLVILDHFSRTGVGFALFCVFSWMVDADTHP